MKKIKLLSIVMVLFTAMGIVSCDTEPVDPNLLDDDGDDDTELPASFKVDFSGQTYVATSTMAVIADGAMAISGMRGTNGEAVTIIIDGTTTGTYTDDAFMTYDPTGAQEYQFSNVNPDINENQDGQGSVTITSINTSTHTISGTFNFTGFWSDADANLPTIAFTNGVFVNIPYTGTVPVDPGTDPEEEEYFTAKVGGTFYDFTDTMTISSSGGYFNFIGIDDNMTSIVLTQKETLTPGNYPITDGILDDVTVSFGDGTNSFNVASGTMTIISKANGWVKGTFSFTATNTEDGTTVEVTEGTFSGEYDF